MSWFPLVSGYQPQLILLIINQVFRLIFRIIGRTIFVWQ